MARIGQAGQQLILFLDIVHFAELVFWELSAPTRWNPVHVLTINFISLITGPEIKHQKSGSACVS